MLESSRPLPPCTGCLHEAGLVVVVATSAPPDELDAMIELLDADDAIDALTSSDDVDIPSRTPMSSSLRSGAGRLTRTGVLLSVTACGHPRRSYRRASRLAVETGGFCHHELSESGAVHVYRDVEEILDQARDAPVGSL
jgi:hypothetical protein